MLQVSEKQGWACDLLRAFSTLGTHKTHEGVMQLLASFSSSLLMWSAKEN